MLILAGVSINAIVGDNGILTRAQEATNKSRLASDLEALQLELANHNVNAFLNQEEAIDTVVKNLFAKNLIDDVNGQKDSQGEYIDYYQYADIETGSKYAVVKKGENSFRIYLQDNGTYSAEHMLTASGGTLVGGTYEVTQDAFASGEGVAENERGKFTIEGDTKVIFNEPLGVSEDGVTASGDMLSIQVKSGAKVKIYFNFNESKKAADGNTYYKLTNSGLKRSAIDVENGGELDMIIAENVVVEVNSGLAEQGDTSDFMSVNQGGYAGIHVPETAILNLYGSGTIRAIGGDAGDGNAYLGSQVSTGGSGGGGAGGTCCSAGGGYSGGGADGFIGFENQPTNASNRGYGAVGGKNGNSGERLIECINILLSGNGYNQEFTSDFCSSLYNKGIEIIAGGVGGVINRTEGHIAGNGGTAGKGGAIKVSSIAQLNAYNGNKYTDGTSYNDGANQTKIYAQDGIVNARYVFERAQNSILTFTIEQEYNANGIAKTNYINPTSKNAQGIGSGAGYIELSNGTYTVDNSMN